MHVSVHDVGVCMCVCAHTGLCALVCLSVCACVFAHSLSVDLWVLWLASDLPFLLCRPSFYTFSVAELPRIMSFPLLFPSHGFGALLPVCVVVSTRPLQGSRFVWPEY